MMLQRHILFIAIFGIFATCLVEESTCIPASSAVTNTIPQGKITGKIFKTRVGSSVYGYLGIPYAQAPQRFKIAEPPVKWAGIRDGTRFGANCVHYRRLTKTVVGSEDCLFLNVYTSVKPTEASVSASKSATQTPGKPVFVYIHGGSFMAQSGDLYSPKYLLDEQIVLVTLNYRLGAFGFLNTLDKESEPNLGLKDQVLALKWVKENIAAFGGDNSKITIFGSSAGAASVSYHLLSPMSKGLFQSAIAQSGSAMCQWALVRHPEKVANSLGTNLGCSVKTTAELMTCLKTKDAKEIAEKQQKLDPMLPSVPFAPSVETSTARNAIKFLTDYPEELFRTGKFNNVPFLTGVNSLDGFGISQGNLLNNTKSIQNFEENWAKLAPIAFGYTETATNPALVSEKIKTFYFGKEKLSYATREKLINANSDRNFYTCIKNSAVYYGKSNAVYLYYFTHESDSSILGDFSPKSFGLKGVSHVDELQYIFPNSAVPEIKDGSLHSDFSKNLIKLWLSFGTDGKPTKTWSRTRQLPTWQPISYLGSQTLPDTSLQWFNIDNDLKSIDEPFLPRIKFWNGLPITNGKYDANANKKGGTPASSPIMKTSSGAKPNPLDHITILEGTSSTTTTTTAKPKGFFSKLIG